MCCFVFRSVLDLRRCQTSKRTRLMCPVLYTKHELFWLPITIKREYWRLRDSEIVFENFMMFCRNDKLLRLQSCSRMILRNHQFPSFRFWVSFIKVTWFCSWILCLKLSIRNLIKQSDRTSLDENISAPRHLDVGERWFWMHCTLTIISYRRLETERKR